MNTKLSCVKVKAAVLTSVNVNKDLYFLFFFCSASGYVLQLIFHVSAFEYYPRL